MKHTRKNLTWILAALSLSSVACVAPDGPTTSVVTREAASEARQSRDYVWGQVDEAAHDGDGLFSASIRVDPSSIDEADYDDLQVRMNVAYVQQGGGDTVHQIFDVPLSDTRISVGEEMVITVTGLELAELPAQASLSATAEITSDPSGLPDFWWAAAQDIEVNTAGGIVPCVHVTRAAWSTCASNEMEMLVEASYETRDGSVTRQQFKVPLSTMDLTDEGGPLVTVEPSRALAISPGADMSTLLLTTSLAWQ